MQKLNSRALDAKDPIANLSREHRVLLSVADSFERYAECLRIGSSGPEELIEFAVFFREFGTTLHHEKEERIAMAALSMHGFLAGGTPRAQLHEEHGREDTLLLTLMRHAMKSPPWDERERAHVASLIAGYCANLRRHTDAEEAVMYPTLRTTLSEQELASVARKLERFDEGHNDAGQVDWLLELAEVLEARYGSAESTNAD